MDDASLARALHVLGVVLWIGGVGFVTTVLLPAVRRMKDPAERVAFFEAIEGRFAWQARFTTLLVGASGFYLVHAWNLWDRFIEPSAWWMHAMVVVWLIFTLMLFVAEPLFLRTVRNFVREAMMMERRIIAWLSIRMYWTGFFLVAIRMKFLRKTGCWTT